MVLEMEISPRQDYFFLPKTFLFCGNDRSTLPTPKRHLSRTFLSSIVLAKVDQIMKSIRVQMAHTISKCVQMQSLINLDAKRPPES